MDGQLDSELDLQQVPSLQNVHEVQEVQWVRAGQTYHPYQQNQKIQMGPANSIKGYLKFSKSQSPSKHSETLKKAIIKIQNM